MTYKQLLEKLQQIPSERLNDDVTVWDYWADEFVAVANLTQNKKDSKHLDTNVLDYEHYVLELNN
jgi:phage terminase Nu1 subunit (DNA packaging protein)